MKYFHISIQTKEHGSTAAVCKRTKKAGKDEWFLAESFEVKNRVLSCPNPDGPCYFAAPADVEENQLKKLCKDIWADAPNDLALLTDLPLDDEAFLTAHVRRCCSFLLALGHSHLFGFLELEQR